MTPLGHTHKLQTFIQLSNITGQNTSDVRWYASSRVVRFSGKRYANRPPLCMQGTQANFGKSEGDTFLLVAPCFSSCGAACTAVSRSIILLYQCRFLSTRDSSRAGFEHDAGKANANG